MNWLIEILFVAVCIGLGKYQAYRFDVLQKRISHLTWGALYAALLIPVWFLTRNIWLVIACILIRVIFFNTALNLFRHKPFFYTNPADPKGSSIDKLYGKAYPVVFFVSVGVLIYLQFKL